MGLWQAVRDVEEPRIGDRPVGLFIVGVASLIIGIAVVAAAIELFLGATLFPDWTRPRWVGNDLVMVTVYPEHYILVGAIILIPALLLLTWPVGIVRQRPWAGILGVVLGGLFTMYGVLALVIPGDAAANTDRWHLAASLPWIALGILLLWYFSRRSIKRDLGMGDQTFG